MHLKNDLLPAMEQLYPRNDFIYVCTGLRLFTLIKKCQRPLENDVKKAVGGKHGVAPEFAGL